MATTTLPPQPQSPMLDASGNLWKNGALVGNLVQAAKAKSSPNTGGTWHSKNGAMGASQGGCSYVYIPSSATTSSSTTVMSGCD